MRRRQILGLLMPMVALTLLPDRMFAAGTPADIVALCTGADTMRLEPDTMLRRIAFQGGKVEKSQTTAGVAYNLKDGFRTPAHVELDKTASGWQVKILALLFGPDDKLALDTLTPPLTKAFGAPQDATTGNTVLVWRGEDRLIRVTADPPGGDPPVLVYAVTITRA
jgi:hypothetical protein